MKLLEPIRINSTIVPNRVVVPAMVTRLSGEDGYVNQGIIDRYVRYAQGHVGLIVVEAMAIHSSKSGPLLRISDETFIPGHRELVQRVLKLVDTNEFKRQQAAPTIRVSEKAFGSGRDMPIAQRWRREPAKRVR